MRAETRRLNRTLDLGNDSEMIWTNMEKIRRTTRREKPRRSVQLLGVMSNKSPHQCNISESRGKNRNETEAIYIYIYIYI